MKFVTVQAMPHIHDLIDFTAEMFIVNKNKVLLRKHEKYHLWLSVGGHIELNEDPNEAVLREVKEEVGLDVTIFNPAKIKNVEGYKVLIPPVFMNRHRINENHEHVTLVYFGISETTKIVEQDHEKADDCRWFTKEELEKAPDIKELTKDYALAALEMLTKQVANKKAPRKERQSRY